ncbi:glycosyltransferase involved in cell wall biosynthesis [Rhodothalassium salexigens DSM 2132]|uniref:Glycosyltransferase involved in cell wall biosynthesis n=1 Tax=Rhodothalassium salexigens DSM 2132 TaxID=1188247 RepID=A0A4R2PE54_RHOSA|nr:glycosyltransferase family 1 protein [Rhodothalassium salexigens]MBB4211907.1 glycosyltransferase involved in cell wall biosynthesis [Rhodothalassium salexigens DSM 2132]MBK1639822.1 alpha-mannosyltransferase [Rhodothalassium salexigens DSM 2132]TCP33509.1 glycosyltransferase involved in cell wall biosynthesis [Rhodothalassium salexigens DSM 2132]
MKIALVSDAWYPQVNGVVRTLQAVRQELRRKGHRVYMITPDRFMTVPCPTYPEIRLAIGGQTKVAHMLDRLGPDAVHVATEGPLGYAARRWCVRRRFPFTTAYHTNFPEYIELRTGIPEDWLFEVVRRFHAPAAGVLVATPTLQSQLARRGFRNLRLWTRGVDVSRFRPDLRTDLGYPGPVMLYVGRVAVEKNLEAFLEVDRPGTKLVVGDGPAMTDLQRRYPEVRFLGVRQGEDLARIYASSDVFVFPSKTDTFGLVMLEALASGIPVAAYRVPGPLDVVGPGGFGTEAVRADGPVGVLDDDLGAAIDGALALDRRACRPYAEGYSWSNCADLFLRHLALTGRSGSVSVAA